jgi:hypothetical protein
VKISASVLLASALCLLLTACQPKSVCPLSSPETAQPDLRLIGDWRDSNDPDHNTFRFSVTKPHWMRVEVIPAKPGAKADTYDCFTTVIENETYLNTRMLEKQDDAKIARYYQFTRYTLSPDGVLQMWMMSEDAVAAAVHAGKLRGNVEVINSSPENKSLHPDVDVTLYDSSAHLVRFIERSNIYALFSEKGNTLRRILPASK